MAREKTILLLGSSYSAALSGRWKIGFPITRGCIRRLIDPRLISIAPPGANLLLRPRWPLNPAGPTPNTQIQMSMIATITAYKRQPSTVSRGDSGCPFCPLPLKGPLIEYRFICRERYAPPWDKDCPRSPVPRNNLGAGSKRTCLSQRDRLHPVRPAKTRCNRDAFFVSRATTDPSHGVPPSGGPHRLTRDSMQFPKSLPISSTASSEEPRNPQRGHLRTLLRTLNEWGPTSESLNRMGGTELTYEFRVSRLSRRCACSKRSPSSGA